MSDLFSLDGKHVLVTGGSSGLGRFFAVFLAARGALVTVAARRAEALAKTVGDIKTVNGRAQRVVMDVTAAASIESALDAAEAHFGPIQIVVNNAGVTATRPAFDQDESDWDKVVEPEGRLAGSAGRGAANGRAQAERLHRQYRLDPWRAGCEFGRTLCDLEGWRRANDQGAGPL